MEPLKNTKPVMAEMLVRHVFGESESFERVCAQRGMNLTEAVHQALKSWVGQALLTAHSEPALPVIGMLPDPSDCPHGQEAHFIDLVEHDLAVLRQRQQACFRDKNQGELAKTTQAIETHIQALAALRERVA
jgi:hypothetical protein